MQGDVLPLSTTRVLVCTYVSSGAMESRGDTSDGLRAQAPLRLSPTHPDVPPGFQRRVRTGRRQQVSAVSGLRFCATKVPINGRPRPPQQQGSPHAVLYPSTQAKKQSPWVPDSDSWPSTQTFKRAAPAPQRTPSGGRLYESKRDFISGMCLW